MCSHGSQRADLVVAVGTVLCRRRRQIQEGEKGQASRLSLVSLPGSYTHTVCVLIPLSFKAAKDAWVSVMKNYSAVKQSESLLINFGACQTGWFC